MEGPRVPALLPMAHNGHLKTEENQNLDAGRSEPSPVKSDPVTESVPETAGGRSSVPAAVIAPQVLPAIQQPQQMSTQNPGPEQNVTLDTSKTTSSPPQVAPTASASVNTTSASGGPTTGSDSVNSGTEKEDSRHELLRPTQTMCLNCMTTNTPLWRRDENGQILCNACGLFLKLHGRRRPISLKTDVIKSRNRSRNAGPPRRFNRKPARPTQSDSPQQLVGSQMPPQLVPAPAPVQPSSLGSADARHESPGQATQITATLTAQSATQPAPGPHQMVQPTISVQPGQQAQQQGQQLPPVASQTPGVAQTPSQTLLGQMRQSMHPLQMGPPASVAGLSPALTAYNFYPTGTPILGPQPGLQPLSAMAPGMSPHMGPLPGRPSSPPDLRLVRGHMSEQLLPRSPPDRVVPLSHVPAAEVIRPAQHSPNMQDLQTKVSELEVINDLLRRRIADLEFSESRARKEAADTRARLEELLSSLRQVSTPSEPNVLTPETTSYPTSSSSLAPNGLQPTEPALPALPAVLPAVLPTVLPAVLPAAQPAPPNALTPNTVPHPAPEPAVKEMKRIRVSELM